MHIAQYTQYIASSQLAERNSELEYVKSSDAEVKMEESIKDSIIKSLREENKQLTLKV